MMDAVFISDLHLHPNMPDILKRFDIFLNWVEKRTRVLYILGDFFHAWAGDDTSDAWSDGIAARLALLNKQGMHVYFMRGNRDFLLGHDFCKRAQLTLLEEPARITLGKQEVLLVHGDRYCTDDRAHQWFRRITRNRYFTAVFKMLPKKLRIQIVMGVRSKSEKNTRKKPEVMDVVPAALIAHLKQCDVQVVIHGHTHKPGVTEYPVDDICYQQYILSDWDAMPSILCYNKSNGFYFNLLSE
ncbi:MAG: UDP-2,3-diacylglucosamine diphosphatase [Gammaproteobacteria bacterium]|nr:UDP-2,3-diacylglucosamine diphosphatase [Gammaproteobacteria bacterium]MCH9716073.1 UDP-2,3-diacylglucosamine diphosphatase [Gammaproteobacteria bacterium]MCH9763410.1 UDP-2,3-diacylglucosamine diphosphatase [Gammaproteobacteria bacterium]